MHLKRLFSAATLGMVIGATSPTLAAEAPAPISSERISQHIKILASDEFEGRKPGTPGEEKTVAYLVEQFRKLGLKPGPDGRYVQDVPLTEITNTLDGRLMIQAKDRRLAYEAVTDAVLWTRHRTERAAIADADMVFVGYGVTAPEWGWDDYAGVDVRGKVVLILINDPGFGIGDPELFNGKAMTWYGRWTYKFEEAARRGAAGAIIVHETEAAAYPWSVVVNTFAVPMISLAPVAGSVPWAPVEGWVQLDTAKEMFAAAGLDFDTLRDAANRRGFKAVPMNLKASMAIQARHRDVISKNVVAMLPGRSRPQEAIVYGAHWDHLGRGQAIGGDDIYNGAIDNASGLAGILEIARRFSQGPQPERSVAFVAFTAEEQGMLGSEYYARNPIFPPKQTVANFNMDALGSIGPVKDVLIVGAGKSELEDMVKVWAQAKGLSVRPEAFPERGSYYRSDHFNFAKVGVPALYVIGGVESVEHGPEWGKAQKNDFLKHHYHQPSDEWRPDMDLRGAVQEVGMFYDLGHELAFGTAWPNWYEGAEFKSVRDASRAAK